MMLLQSFLISILLLSTSIDAQKHRSARAPGPFDCSNLGYIPCNFVVCENGGVCQADDRNADCYSCLCPAGLTGKICETTIIITPSGCNPSCENGGACVGNVCSCPAGFNGPSCGQRDFCAPSNPCQNGGRCTSTGNSYLCDCANTGFTGTICTDAVVNDPCASRPCQNNGQCSSNNGVASCLCINGFSGTSCQIAPIPCAGAPCLNGGVCNSIGVNTFACTCPATFTGRQCETQTFVNHPCFTSASTVCQNGGTCTVNGAGYLCRCATGFSGDNCQTAQSATSCTPSPCGAHGTCISAVLPTGTLAVCNCEDRWTGKFCDVNMNGCTPGYCENGGVCQLLGTTQVCSCPPTHTGPRCETSLVNPVTTTTTTTTAFPPTTTTPSTSINCAARPCLNGATCYNTGNSFFCGCTSQWTGTRCENLKNPSGSTTTTTPSPSGTGCSPNPCSNGGSCFKSGNSFVCVCSSQFTGATCTEAKTTTVPTPTTIGSNLRCVNRPCQNGGSCYDSGNTYFCYCGRDFTGKNCESRMAASTCPLKCAPPACCVITGDAQVPYACASNDSLNPTRCS